MNYDEISRGKICGACSMYAENMNVQKDSGLKPGRKRSLEGPEVKREDNIKTDLKDMQWEAVYWFQYLCYIILLKY
jgi:hypothetical protein